MNDTIRRDVQIVRLKHLLSQHIFITKETLYVISRTVAFPSPLRLRHFSYWVLEYVNTLLEEHGCCH